MTERSVAPTVEEIDRFRPEYLSGSASALMSLASHMRQTGIRMKTPLKVVTITLGAANAAQRREMEAAFGCPVSQNLGERVGGSGGLHVSRRPPPCDG